MLLGYISGSTKGGIKCILGIETRELSSLDSEPLLNEAIGAHTLVLALALKPMLVHNNCLGNPTRARKSPKDHDHACPRHPYSCNRP